MSRRKLDVSGQAEAALSDGSTGVEGLTEHQQPTPKTASIHKAESGHKGASEQGILASELTATPLLHINPSKPEPELIAQAAALLTAGKVLVIPTDTVYGIAVCVCEGASPLVLANKKQRAPQKSIPLLVADHTALEEYADEVPEYAHALASKHWPGALTLVVRASHKLPSAFVAADGSVALRMPDSAITLALLTALQAPLACTSANLSGEAPALQIAELDPTLLSAVDALIDGGPVATGSASTVVSCLEEAPRVLRKGPLTI